MEVIIELNGQRYNAIYNSESGFFELNLVSPNIGGVYDINITAKDSYGGRVDEVEKLQVLLTKEEKIVTNKVIAYFLDRFTFEIKDVVDIQDYNINIDEETNAKTTLTVLKRLKSGDGDFVFIYENNKIIYMGIIESPVSDGENKYSITSKYITNLFDRDILVDNESLISETGVEDFIKYTIENEFINSEDELLNIKYLDIDVVTHTNINKAIDNVENGIYNFHTYITNCTQNYNISYIFSVENGRLKMSIEKQDEEQKLIDANVSDIANYTEVFKKSVTAKVNVKTSNNIYRFYLLANRTITTNMEDENRAIGMIKTVYTEKDEDAEQTALNEFKSNSYEHLVEFDVNSLSKLYDVNNWKIGTPIKMKTRNNIIIDSYISSISKKKNSNFYSIKTGNIRITLLDILNKRKK